MEIFEPHFQQLAPFFDEFTDFDRFHFVDGGSLIRDTEKEFGLLETFLGVKEELKFKFNEEKSFNCLEQPIPMCLSSAKGNKIPITGITISGMLFPELIWLYENGWNHS